MVNYDNYRAVITALGIITRFLVDLTIPFPADVILGRRVQLAVLEELADSVRMVVANVHQCCQMV